MRLFRKISGNICSERAIGNGGQVSHSVSPLRPIPRSNYFPIFFLKTLSVFKSHSCHWDIIIVLKLLIYYINYILDLCQNSEIIFGYIILLHRLTAKWGRLHVCDSSHWLSWNKCHLTLLYYNSFCIRIKFQT